MNLLAGTTCVVTGGGRGIGRYSAETLARHGARLALCSRTADELAETAEVLAGLGAEVLTQVVDVADYAAVAQFAAEAQKRFGRVHVLINNAGVIGPLGPITEVDMGAWGQAVAVDLLGVAHAIRAFAPGMRDAGGGRILNLSGGGVGGPGPQGGMSAYTASKAAVVSLTETLARELAPYNITVNAVAPGAAATRMTDTVLAAGPAVAGEELYASFARQRAAGDSLEKLGEVMVFLASGGAGALTGKLISAKWDPLARLAEQADALNASSAYTLRRIDGELFAEVPRK